jgi:FKBP-type peptidyl-prolyl cis-trans isomerase 2
VPAEQGQGARPGRWAMLEPGQFVRHPARPDWGEGQVQSVIGERVTVNFEHAGKVLINARLVALEPIEP